MEHLPDQRSQKTRHKRLLYSFATRRWQRDQTQGEITDDCFIPLHITDGNDAKHRVRLQMIASFLYNSPM